MKDTRHGHTNIIEARTEHPRQGVINYRRWPGRWARSPYPVRGNFYCPYIHVINLCGGER